MQARTARGVGDERMRLRSGNEGIVDLEVATAHAAKSGRMPCVAHGHLLARSVAAETLVLGGRAAAFCGQHHEVRCMRRAAAEGPAAAHTPTASGARRLADGAGRADDEAAWRNEPGAHGLGRQVAGDAAHAAAIANQPSDRSVERHRGFDDVHEGDRRELVAAEGAGQPEAEQPCIGECREDRVREAPLTVERGTVRAGAGATGARTGEWRARARVARDIARLRLRCASSRQASAPCRDPGVHGLDPRGGRGARRHAASTVTLTSVEHDGFHVARCRRTQTKTCLNTELENR